MGFEERVKNVREALGKTQKEMAGIVDVGLRTWQQYEEGKHDPSWKVVMKLAELGCNTDWLASGEGKMWRSGCGPWVDRMVAAADRLDAAREAIEPSKAEVEPYPSKTVLESFVFIPRYEVSASAGGGSMIRSEQIVDHLTFKKEWIHRLGLSEKDLALINVNGDSMEPTLSDMDLILIDLRARDVKDNAIYVLQVDSGLLVKRIQRRLDGSVIVSSDNKMYEPETYNGDRLELLNIVGRVVWCGRKM